MDTHIYTHHSTPTQPLESPVETAGHTARGGQCLHGLGRRAGSARAVWQPVPFPSLQAWTTSIYTAGWRAKGRVCPGVHPALHLGTPPLEWPLEERVGRRWRGSTGDTTHPSMVAQARRGTAGAKQVAGPSGRARVTGRVGGGERSWQAGGWWWGWAQAAMPEAPRLEPGPGPSTALPGGSTRRHSRPYLAGEHQPGHLPPSGERCGGDEGNSVAKTRVDGGQPRTGDHGAQIPSTPAQRASSGPCDQSLPREVGGPGAGNLGAEASTSNPSSSPAGRAYQHPACPSLPDSSPVVAALGPYRLPFHPPPLISLASRFYSFPAGEAAAS